ncbi:MAG: hypothetical protein JWN03_4105 [Nocardia sp.]|nr:hypothetical protein [Nocardia sp.]
MGFRLPADYHDFINLYGEGQINQELSVFAPAYQTADRPSLTSLLDRSRWLKSIGFFEEFGPVPLDEYQTDPAVSDSVDLLMWGKTWHGDMFFWVAAGDDPAEWPIAVHLHHLDPGDRWRRFDGGMAECLTSVVDGSFAGAAKLIDANPGGAQWSRLRDWEHDYGKPPSAVFDQVVDEGDPYGPRVISGSPIPLHNYGYSGGDQAHFRSTGELRSLIGMDPTGTEIQLHGGSQSPGIAYFLYSTVDFGPKHLPGTVGVDLLRNGDRVASAAPDPTNLQRVCVAAEILVDAGAPATSVQLRVVADAVAQRHLRGSRLAWFAALRRARTPEISVESVYLRVKGTLRTA